MPPTFSIREALRVGWRKTRENSGALFGTVITLVVVSAGDSLLQRSEFFYTAGGFLLWFVLFIATIVIGTGFTLMTLNIAKGNTAHYADIVPPANLIWPFFAASLLAGVIILLGLVLLIIPGIYFMLRFSMVRFAILDGATILSSLRRSSEITKEVRWQVLGFIIVMVLLNILGAICLLVGLLVTIPVTSIAYAHIYLTLAKRVPVSVQQKQ